MKSKKLFLFAVLPTLAASFLAGCNKGPEEPEEPKPLEIGDTVKIWTNDDEFEDLPIGFLSNKKGGSGQGSVVYDLGREDNTSLNFVAKTLSNGKGYLSTDALEEQYFTEDDAKNGDIISAYVYVEEDSNLASFQLTVLPSSMNESNMIKGNTVTIDAEHENTWLRTMASFDTIETLGAIRINYTAVDASLPVSFYLDDIEIVLGEETVKTDYEYKDESLYQTYEDFFKVGTCMSATMLKNTTLRKITKDNFNSVTAENEGKPEQVLDQAACQKLAKGGDPSGVAITTAPFEKLYNFAEANHIGVRHHTFVWYSQTPEWFFNVGYNNNGSKVSKDVMLQRMENFIKISLETINERWPGLVYAIDVANEAVDNAAVRSSNNKWYDVVGKDFVYYAFLYANEYKEDWQEIYYNDYSYDYNVNNCNFALNTLLKQVIAEQLIDGVGIQGHIDSDQNMDVIINDAKAIMKKGLKCQITELDITVNGTDNNAWKKQQSAYKLLLKKVLKSNIKGETDINAVIVWGITDNYSWKGSQNPLLFTSSYAKKPAYYGFLEAIKDVPEAQPQEVEEE